MDDIAMKYQALDREVKYLINKAKMYRPKTKPKASKNTTATNNTKADTNSSDSTSGN